MNILQKFLQLENNDILNKIYSYLGKHPIIEKTRLKDAITTYTMRLKTDFDYQYYSTSNNKKTFSYFYFNNLRNVREYKIYIKNKKKYEIKCRYSRIKYGFNKVADSFNEVANEYDKLLYYYDNNLLFDYEEFNNLQIFSNFYFYNLKIYKLIVSHRQNF